MYLTTILNIRIYTYISFYNLISKGITHIAESRKTPQIGRRAAIYTCLCILHGSPLRHLLYMNMFICIVNGMVEVYTVIRAQYANTCLPSIECPQIEKCN